MQPTYHANVIYPKYPPKLQPFKDVTPESTYRRYPLSYVGLKDINEIRTFICGENGIKQGLICDFEGNEICDSVIGLKIIGNIFENGDLLK